jgi:50S ribosomal protein L16 3-hydroxylase
MPNTFCFDKSRVRYGFFPAVAFFTVAAALHIIVTMKSDLLGGLSPRAFLQRHWQKRPLFVRGALPGFAGIADAQALKALAARDDVESRAVERRDKAWNVLHGPFRGRIRLKRSGSTLLVSGVNLHLAEADALLRRFDFVPQARLDDVMVSYATPGGGVGPHVDSYDVFLLQGAGRRRWRTWLPNGSFHKEYVAQAGDLLYLPPGWKHDGVALDDCYTYSIGFRAPRGAELAAAFLDWLNERGLPDATYRDPGLAPAKKPAQLPKEMIRFSRKVLARISWKEKDVADFLGRYLTEPKAHVVFRPSARRGLAGSLLRLDPRTQLLYSNAMFFVNGESFLIDSNQKPLMEELADRRVMEGRRLARPPLAGLISGWVRAGYAHLERMKP